jgi:hypothetical protein
MALKEPSIYINYVMNLIMLFEPILIVEIDNK